jgi:hypothetical protein
MLKNISDKNLELFRLETKRYFEVTTQGAKQNESQTDQRQMLTDKVTLGEESEAVFYDASMKIVGLEGKYGLLRDLVVRTLQEQGVAVKVATNEGEIDISCLTQEDATALISDDGYFGVEQTSERIFTYAIGIAGNDPGRIDEIRKGVQTGLEQAEAAWGGTLPDISYKTIEAVMSKLDGWIADSLS